MAKQILSDGQRKELNKKFNQCPACKKQVDFLKEPNFCPNCGQKIKTLAKKQCELLFKFHKENDLILSSL